MAVFCWWYQFAFRVQQQNDSFCSIRRFVIVTFASICVALYCWLYNFVSQLTSKLICRILLAISFSISSSTIKRQLKYPSSPLCRYRGGNFVFVITFCFIDLVWKFFWHFMYSSSHLHSTVLLYCSSVVHDNCCYL